MSSHHIVKDDQEPALIIANGAACHTELLGQLLEWSPYIVVLDSAIERVMALQIKIDVLLGDFDRDFCADAYLKDQYPIEIVHTPNQDKTDLEKALDFLIAKNFAAVNIVWATGRRADHTLNNLSTLAKYHQKIKIVLLDDYSKVYVLPRQFQKWYPAQTIISLMPIGVVTGVTSSNLFYSLQNDTLELGVHTSSSNHVAQDGLVHIAHQSGVLLMMECQDNS